MRPNLTSLIRLLVLLAIASTAAAVGVARVAPRPSGPERRLAGASTGVGLNRFSLVADGSGSVWLDPASGRTSEIPNHSGVVLNFLSGSPWSDAAGRSQAIGRWSLSVAEEDAGSHAGLTRISLPDGEVLDRIATDLLPIGYPCWYPGTAARVLFAAGDGRLYQVAFEHGPGLGSFGGSVDGDPEPQPRPLRWAVATAGDGPAFVADVHWPRAPRFRRLLLASIHTQGPLGPHRPLSRTRLWWLRLDEAGEEIEGSGRLDEGGEPLGEVDDRAPTLVATADGSPAIAFLRKVDGRGWDLHVAPLRFDPAGSPEADLRDSTRLVQGCQLAPPTASADGRSLHLIKRLDRLRGMVVRVETGATPARSSPAEFGLARAGR